MEIIIKLFYDSYLKENFKNHYKTRKELDDKSKMFLETLSNEQYQMFIDYDIAFENHISDREQRIIGYIFSLLSLEI